MSGNTEDLNSGPVGKAIVSILQDDFGQDITRDEAVKLMGIKRTNANHLQGSGKFGTALYSIYPLMNSNCYCNTVCSIDPKTRVLTVCLF